MQDLTIDNLIDNLDGEFVAAFRDQVKAKITLDKAREAFDEALKINGMSEYWDYVKADEEYELRALSHLLTSVRD